MSINFDIIKKKIRAQLRRADGRGAGPAGFSLSICNKTENFEVVRGIALSNKTRSFVEKSQAS